MAQNGRTSFTAPDSEGARPSGSNGAGMFFDAARRRDRLVRRESAFRRTSPQHNVQEAYGHSDEEVETAANYLCDLLKSGRVTIEQVELEQRQDADKLAGWTAVGLPQSGSENAAKVAAIHHRMAVRNRALELNAIYDMRPAPDSTITPDQPTWKPWRPGATSKTHRTY